mmetsp:Transcript_10350/g.24912  ORF Transcript_10350/g.24912 Transcript_10350/m.24912 type:complete len:220 (+) Transcript_10350:1102-1761(+)
MCDDRGEPLVRALGAHHGHPECGGDGHGCGAEPKPLRISVWCFPSLCSHAECVLCVFPDRVGPSIFGAWWPATILPGCLVVLRDSAHPADDSGDLGTSSSGSLAIHQPFRYRCKHGELAALCTSPARFAHRPPCKTREVHARIDDLDQGHDGGVPVSLLHPAASAYPYCHLRYQLHGIQSRHSSGSSLLRYAVEHRRYTDPPLHPARPRGLLPLCGDGE